MFFALLLLRAVAVGGGDCVQQALQKFADNHSFFKIMHTFII
jgi:hypothetical protein